MTEERVITLDLGYEEWPITENRAYRKAVGVNAPYAAAKIDEARAADLVDLLSHFSAEDEQLYRPAGWAPLNMLNIDPDWLLGFAWVPARRDQPELTFEEYAEQVKGGELLEALTESMIEGLPQEVRDELQRLEDESGPFVATPPASPPRKTGSRRSTKSSSSPTSTSGRSRKSAPSPSSSSR